jgi:nudix-type nucleoside diphosphatase (YffH/AdpP family)
MVAEIIDSKNIYDGWIRLIQSTLRLTDGKPVSREIIIHGRASAVLPYDPERRVVVLVKLLRAPVLFATGVQNVVEAPAGMVDDESPDDTARREAMEESGLRLKRLEHVGSAWSSPGVSTERINLYLAPYSKSDLRGSGGGLPSEDENITVVEMPSRELLASVERLEICDLETLTLALALRWKHPDLFAGSRRHNKRSCPADRKNNRRCGRQISRARWQDDNDARCATHSTRRCGSVRERGQGAGVGKFRCCLRHRREMCDPPRLHR